MFTNYIKTWPKSDEKGFCKTLKTFDFLKMRDYHKWEQNTANWKYYRTKLLIATCIAILTSISSVGSLLLLSTICKKVRTDDFKWIELKYSKCSKLAIIF